MSYQLFDSFGYVGDIATNSGLATFRRWLDKLDRDKPVNERHLHVNGFLRTGAALMTKEFVDELNALEPSAADKTELADTLSNLKIQVAKCDSIAIINNSLEGD